MANIVMTVTRRSDKFQMLNDGPSEALLLPFVGERGIEELPGKEFLLPLLLAVTSMPCAVLLSPPMEAGYARVLISGPSSVRPCTQRHRKTTSKGKAQQAGSFHATRDCCFLKQALPMLRPFNQEVIHQLITMRPPPLSWRKVALVQQTSGLQKKAKTKRNWIF